MVTKKLDVLGWVYHEILIVVPHDPALSSLVYSLCYVAACWVPVYFLYRRRIFIKI
jgi:predicted acyltransferase